MTAHSITMDDFDSEPRLATTEVFDSGHKTIVDFPHVRVERLDTEPMLFSKVFKQFEGQQGLQYDYRYWAERENFFLREFLKKKKQFLHVVQPRHLISENEAARQVLTCDAGITVANWLRVRPRYADGRTLAHPFQRPRAWLELVRSCLLALREIHQHGIVHCDIKEDNICVPYAPYPYSPLRDAGADIHLEFDNLKLIDFAFSVAHWMPLTQILIINPDDRAPYQSARLIDALRADRISGSPEAVQQLDYRVDLFSLGYLAGKIMGSGLDCPQSAEGRRVLEGTVALVGRLKSYDTVEVAGELPHDALIEDVDRLLVAAAGFPDAMQFEVAGEWTATEMRSGRTRIRKTPLTPVAPPVPTPIALPAPILRTPGEPPGILPQARPPLVPSRLLLGIFLGVAVVLAGAIAVVGGRDTAAWQTIFGAFTKKAAPASAPARAPVAPDPFKQAASRLGAQLRGDDEQAFQSAWAELAAFVSAGKPAAVELSQSIAGEYGRLLESPAPIAKRNGAYTRLQWMAKNGGRAAQERIAAFEKTYDQVKQNLAASAWWLRGQGYPPPEAQHWMESGAVLAYNGDRPAMLDRAFAYGNGRLLKLDRAAAVQTYLDVIARAPGSDEASARIRLAAAHGLAAMLNRVVEQKDQDAARALQPVLEQQALGGAADMQYYLGLISECVIRPPDLEAAAQRYRLAAADPAWKPTADKKLAVLGKWCPAPAR
jgi:hypothetical protein